MTVPGQVHDLHPDLTAPRPSCWLRRCCPLEPSLHPQGRPCGRPPPAAVLGRQRIPGLATAFKAHTHGGASMSSKTPQRDKPQPKGLVSGLSTANVIVSLIASLIVIAGTVSGYIVYRNKIEKEKYAKTAEAEYERLAKLKAGITLSRFQAILEQEEAEVVTSGSGGLTRHLYARPYDYVLAVTDKNQRVVSFSVMVRKQNFHPRFDRVVLGQTTLASAVDDPEALAGVCGRPVAYFERTGLSTATPIATAVGITASGHADKKDLDLVCKADPQLDKCGGYLVGDADLARKAVDCFLNTPEGKRLRENLRPNIYTEAAVYQDLSFELITPFEPEILTAERLQAPGS
jgi:hypothetical protein